MAADKANDYANLDGPRQISSAQKPKKRNKRREKRKRDARLVEQAEYIKPEARKSYRELAEQLLPVTSFAGAFTLNAYFNITCPESLSGVCLHTSAILFLICPLGLILIRLLLDYYPTQKSDDARPENDTNGGKENEEITIIVAIVLFQLEMIALVLAFAFLLLSLALYLRASDTRFVGICGIVIVAFMVSLCLIFGFLGPLFFLYELYSRIIGIDEIWEMITTTLTKYWMKFVTNTGNRYDEEMGPVSSTEQPGRRASASPTGNANGEVVESTGTSERADEGNTEHTGRRASASPTGNANGEVVVWTGTSERADGGSNEQQAAAEIYLAASGKLSLKRLLLRIAPCLLLAEFFVIYTFIILAITEMSFAPSNCEALFNVSSV
ncbi:hypothetical protein N7467_001967 [Penicillium canescens]|nr:hypothetical protein N7467_001967 [Penicillium canescens]